MTNEQRLEKLAARLSQQEETISQLQQTLNSLNATLKTFATPTRDDKEGLPINKYCNTRAGVRDQIMENFEFEKVASVCQHMNWEIYKEPNGVTVEFLKRDALEKMNQAWEAFDSGEAEDEWIIHSGPLKLWWCECDEGIFAELTFVAEEFRVEPV